MTINPYQSPAHNGEDNNHKRIFDTLAEFPIVLIMLITSPLIFLALGLWFLWEQKWSEAVLMFVMVLVVIIFWCICCWAILDSIALWN